MIATHIFEIDRNAIFYVVGTPAAIKDLRQFAAIHSESNDLLLETLMERIQMHDAFCYVKPLSLIDQLMVQKFKRQLLRTYRWIDFDSYLGAYIVAEPEDALQTLPFSVEQLIDIAKDNPWLRVFDVDEETVISRLRAAVNSPREDPSSQNDHSC